MKSPISVDGIIHFVSKSLTTYAGFPEGDAGVPTSGFLQATLVAVGLAVAATHGGEVLGAFLGAGV